MRNAAWAGAPQSTGEFMPFRCRHSLTPNTGICATIILLCNVAASGQQGTVYWNQFRGPNGQGVAPADRIPVHFNPETNVLWKTAVPGAPSPPVIWDSPRLFTAVSQP